LSASFLFRIGRSASGVLVAAIACALVAAPALAGPGAAMRYPKQFREVLGTRMAYVDVGEGDPIVFLHGNPTSSYLWRNVIPHLEASGRCVAPDMVGMGDSAKLPPRQEDGRDGRYRFVEQRRYMDALLDQLGVERDVVLVIHDWGSAMGFDWARRHEDRVRGIAYMEAITQPASFDGAPFWTALMFRAMRGPLGEWLILRLNLFVDRALPGAVLRELEPEELAAYRAPYLEPGEDRRPTLTWPREVPFDGEPADTHRIVSDYAKWLETTAIPKLLIVGDPGAILRGPALERARGFRNQQEVTVPGLHFLQEDSPDEIGEAIADWIATLPRGQAGPAVPPQSTTDTHKEHS